MVDEPYLYLEGKVAAVMSPNPIVISREESLEKLLDVFKTYHYHGFPVVDERGELVGIVRDTDIISIFARRDPASVAYRTVEDIMHAPPLIIDSDETIQNAIMKMFADQTRFLVVVDKEGKVVGVVTRTDLIKGVHVRRPRGNGF
jgi:CBS domain-containing protein